MARSLLNRDGMADSILFAIGVWFAVQLPVALILGAIIRAGREPDPVDCEANPDMARVTAA